VAGLWERYQRMRLLQSRMGTRAGTRHALIETFHQGDVRRIGSPPVAVRIGSADVETYMQVVVNREYDLEYPYEPKFIVDAGAHIGLSALWFARRFPAATIVAIELERSNYELLVANTFGHANIQTLHAALWPQSGSVAVANADTPTWAFRAVDGVGVPALTVLDVMERFDIDRIGLLKLDIEGAEREVLSTSECWMDRVDMMVAEVHDRLVPGCTRALMDATSGFTYEQWRGENILLAR
jgi:FkbM family methyltransferase